MWSRIIAFPFTVLYTVLECLFTVCVTVLMPFFDRFFAVLMPVFLPFSVQRKRNGNFSLTPTVHVHVGFTVDGFSAEAVCYLASLECVHIRMALRVAL